ncbi:Methionyl-tRNA formyltransferase [Dirofilaria immitis]
MDKKRHGGILEILRCNFSGCGKSGNNLVACQKRTDNVKEIHIDSLVTGYDSSAGYFSKHLSMSRRRGKFRRDRKLPPQETAKQKLQEKFQKVLGKLNEKYRKALRWNLRMLRIIGCFVAYAVTYGSVEVQTSSQKF